MPKLPYSSGIVNRAHYYILSRKIYIVRRLVTAFRIGGVQAGFPSAAPQAAAYVLRLGTLLCQLTPTFARRPMLRTIFPIYTMILPGCRNESYCYIPCSYFVRTYHESRFWLQMSYLIEPGGAVSALPAIARPDWAIVAVTALQRVSRPLCSSYGLAGLVRRELPVVPDGISGVMQIYGCWPVLMGGAADGVVLERYGSVVKGAARLYRG